MNIEIEIIDKSGLVSLIIRGLRNHELHNNLCQPKFIILHNKMAYELMTIKPIDYEYGYLQISQYGKISICNVSVLRTCDIEENKIIII